jgi:hypothetical protein
VCVCVCVCVFVRVQVTGFSQALTRNLGHKHYY